MHLHIHAIPTQVCVPPPVSLRRRQQRFGEDKQLINGFALSLFVASRPRTSALFLLRNPTTPTSSLHQHDAP